VVLTSQKEQFVLLLSKFYFSFFGFEIEIEIEIEIRSQN